MTEVASNTAVVWTTDDRGVATVTLNRPERNNAYNADMINGLHLALDALGSTSDVRGVLIRGEGRFFQAGADLKWLNSVREQDADANITASRATAAAVDRFNRLPIPTFAAVRGACIGGGTGLLAATDVVIAAQTAKFAISEVRWGLTAAIIVPQLVDAIGVRQLRRYAVTGEMFNAAEAHRIGLVHEIVADDALDARVDEIIAKTLENAPDAIAQTKAQTLGQGRGLMTPDLHEHLISAHAAKRQSAEAAEGMASFAEKRPARWAGEA
ncbi:MAG: enoyl-CoA hydratase-related protein [Pseudomonadota bacterium]